MPAMQRSAKKVSRNRAYTVLPNMRRMVDGRNIKRMDCKEHLFFKFDAHRAAEGGRRCQQMNQCRNGAGFVPTMNTALYDTLMNHGIVRQRTF